MNREFAVSAVLYLQHHLLKSPPVISVNTSSRSSFLFFADSPLSLSFFTFVHSESPCFV